MPGVCLQQGVKSLHEWAVACRPKTSGLTELGFGREVESGFDSRERERFTDESKIVPGVLTHVFERLLLLEHKVFCFPASFFFFHL